MPTEFEQWIYQQLPLVLRRLDLDPSHITLTPLNGDAGFRRYYRLISTDFSEAYLAVFAPPETENTHAFVDIARFLYAHGVRVPKVHSCNKNNGWLLIEDLGNTHLLDCLSADTVNGLYGEALTGLLHMQTLPRDAVFPHYNGTLLHAELALFSRWFVEVLLGLTLTASEQAVVDGAFNLLVDQATAQPQVVVHRDFHSRNILLAGSAPALIDFQDAVIGPITYDLVSLLKDCYIAWPKIQVKQWAVAYGNLALDAGLISNTSEKQFLTWFDLMGLQRHIKVLGVFARLHLRDNKSDYLNDLPLVVHYVRDVLHDYDDLSDFAALFEQRIMPVINKQSWMKEVTIHDA